MYIQVKLLKGLAKPLTYKVPVSWQQKDLVGTIIRVPLRNHFRPALVIKQMQQSPLAQTIAIKEADQIEPFPDDHNYYTFVEQLATYYQTESTDFIKRTTTFLHQKEIKAEPLAETDNSKPKETIQLTDEQQTVVNAVKPALEKSAYQPTLIHGVTGSGKTEIYKKLIAKALHENKSSLLLLPEVTLALQFEQLLRSQLPDDIPLYSFHSATSTRIKRLVWQRLIEKKPVILLGVHMPIMLPIANLGLIIIDEEHDTGYQEKKHPKVNSKEAAIMRAQLYGIPIVLGSATPTVSSLYNVKKRGWQFFQLKKRFAGAFPTIKTVLLPEKKLNRRSFWISKELEQAIAERLRNKEQSIIFLNRRGFSFFVQCKKCAYTFTCSNCSVSLTLHENNRLSCHYCGKSKQVPAHCPSCKAPEKDLLKKGVGTQQIVTILQRIFPHARIGRADLDTTQKKKLWRETLDNFEQGNLDILVGTQTITKGYHFKKVTLVGIVWADLNINFPIYNAAETTLQQLIQVAGRAGRHYNESLVIAQTMIDHPIFNYLNETDYLNFYNHELEKRQILSYPPYGRFAEIELKHTSEKIIERDAELLAQHLHHYNEKYEIGVQILGPATPVVHRIKRTFSRKIYLKGDSIASMTSLFQAIKTIKVACQVFFTPNPLQ